MAFPISPLVVMDYQKSLRMYLQDNTLPEYGPLVMNDEELVTRLASTAMGQELKPEKCYPERLWLEVGTGWTGGEDDLASNSVSSRSISEGAI